MDLGSGRRVSLRVTKKKEEEPQPGSSRTGPQGKSTGRALDEIGEAWEALTVRLRTQIQIKRTRKGQKRIDFNKVIDVLERYALSHGFSNEELVWIWDVAINNDVKLNSSQRKRMLFAMVPNELVTSVVITKIVFWINSDQSKKCMVTVLVAVYQLLNMYVEYELVEPSIISIITDTDNLVIPWKMHLFRNTVTPACVSDIQANELKKMMDKDKLKSTQREVIKTCLLLVNILQGKNPDNAGRCELKHRKLKYPEGTRELFYKRKMELLAKEADSVQ